MNIGDFLHNRKWRTIQNYTYSFGASVVLIGALAKLEHWPQASAFLMTGLGMEALIFFISAFEPLLENPDWKRVYPQLREGDESQRNLDIYKELDKKSGRTTPGDTGGVISFKDLPKEQIDLLNASINKLSNAAKGISDISEANLSTQKFIFNLETASQSLNGVVASNATVSQTMVKNVENISESYITAAQKILSASDNASNVINQSSDDLSNSIKSTGEEIRNSGGKASAGIVQSVGELSNSLKTTSEGIKVSTEKASESIIQSAGDLSNSLKLTGEGIKASSEKASEKIVQSAGDLSSSIKIAGEGIKVSGEKASSGLSQSVNELSVSVKGTANDIKKSGEDFGKQLQTSTKELNDSYHNVAESLTSGIKKLETSSGIYIKSIDELNKKLGALNAAYELNRMGAINVDKVVNDYSNSVVEVSKVLHTSLEETRKFNESTKEINENIQALNKVYGRTLGALNTKK
jgi:gliding motility-associated protein GldL